MSASAWLTGMGLFALGGLALAVLVSLTWLTFPTASVIRNLGGSNPERWVRQALGAGARLRDLGQVHEAEVQLGEVRLRMTWSVSHTRIEARGERTPPREQPLEELRRLGAIEIDDALIWSVDRPPDPQLRRVVSLVVRALAR